LNFKTVSRVVEEVGERYGDFNDYECRALKEILIDQESQSKPGMLRLADFYRAGMNQTYWNFNEKADYLRVLGALDESGSEPHLIIPNYISSVANCVPVSDFYTVCCRSECETLMGNLELELKSPAAEPGRITKAVEALPESSVTTSSKLSRTLLNLLEGIAATNDGVVPLHSRAFAQWMHHAFPRECPAPHDSSRNPQTPDEWLREFGADSAKASTEEISQHLEISDAQAHDANHVESQATGNVPAPKGISRTPLLVKHRQVPALTHLKNTLFLHAEADEEFKEVMPASKRISRKPLLVKHHPVSALTHLKNALFLHAEVDEEFQEVMPWHPQECETEEPLPCVESLEALKELMPWEPQECEEEVFTPPEVEVERPKKLKLQTIKEVVSGTMHGPEPQPSTPKLSLQAILASSTDLKSNADDILWEVYNEPAETYWDREDRARQELDKSELSEVPTVPPQSPDVTIPQSSNPTLGDALESSAHELSALLLVTGFLTFLVAFQYVSSKSRPDKTYSSYSKIHEARQDELLRAAAVGCVGQQWSLGGSCQLRCASTDMV